MKQIMGILLILVLSIGDFLPAEVQAVEEQTAVGGIHILKTDVTGNPLEGAVFQIVREIQEDELADNSQEKVMVKVGGENRIMEITSFWNSREMKGQRQHEVETDKNGKAAIYGLPYGTYYLVEKKAPAGFNKVMEPIRVTIHKYSHLTQEDNIVDDDQKIIDNTVHIINVRYTLPDTGNFGRIQFTAACAGILFSSASLILLNLRRWK